MSEKMERLERVEETKKWYKVCRVVGSKTVSLVGWNTPPSSEVSYIPKCLEYETGKITYAPEGTQGIFVLPSLEKAYEEVFRNGSGNLCVIYEVTPLGSHTKGWDDYDCFLAVLVGDKVGKIRQPIPMLGWSEAKGR